MRGGGADQRSVVRNCFIAAGQSPDGIRSRVPRDPRPSRLSSVPCAKPALPGRAAVISARVASGRLDYVLFSLHCSFRRLAAFVGRWRDPGWGPLERPTGQVTVQHLRGSHAKPVERYTTNISATLRCTAILSKRIACLIGSILARWLAQRGTHCLPLIYAHRYGAACPAKGSRDRRKSYAVIDLAITRQACRSSLSAEADGHRGLEIGRGVGCVRLRRRTAALIEPVNSTDFIVQTFRRAIRSAERRSPAERSVLRPRLARPW